MAADVQNLQNRLSLARAAREGIIAVIENTMEARRIVNVRQIEAYNTFADLYLGLQEQIAKIERAQEETTV